MFRKIFTIIVLIIVLIEIQKLECSSVEQRISYLRPNCEQVDHIGKCVKNPTSMKTLPNKSNRTPKRLQRVKYKI